MIARKDRVRLKGSFRLEGSENMNVLIPMIGITCIGLLIYYIYILMRSDS